MLIGETKMLNHRLTIKLNEDIWQKIDDLSKKLGEPRSTIVRSSVILYLKQWGAI